MFQNTIWLDIELHVVGLNRRFGSGNICRMKRGKAKGERMNVTLRQIAEASGMSIQTVSYVLGDKADLFRPETRQRVVAAAQSLGYRPNTSARAMRQGKFNAISLLLSIVADRSRVSLALLDGVLDAAADNRLHVNVAKVPDDKLTDDGFVPKILAENASDGLLINYTDHIPDKMVDLLRRNQVPSVWLNTRQQSQHCVFPDDLDAGLRATEELIRLGHKRIAYVDYTWGYNDIGEAHYSVLDREAGYQQAMSNAGLKQDVIRMANHVHAMDRMGATRKWLAREPRPTAVVCYGSSIALPVMRGLAEMNLSVPGDVSVVTFGESGTSDYAQDIRTWLVPQREMAQAAVMLLLRKIKGDTSVSKSTRLPFGIWPGATTAPPRGG